jgi:hypothetical protein
VAPLAATLSDQVRFIVEGGNRQGSVAILPGASHRMQVRQADGSQQIAPGFQDLVSGWIAGQLAA